MSNYFPNARPLESTLATMTALSPSSYTCIGVFVISTNVTNLKAALLTQYDTDPNDFPAYEARRDFEAALDKVEATFLVAGKYGFPALTSTTKVTAPSTGVMIYGNNNFQGLSIDGTTACNITLYIRQ
jgi:hypothetical protein